MLPTLPPAPRPEGEILHEVTRSICPECRIVIDAQVLLRDDNVYMRKRCPEHGWFEGLIYADATAYVSQARYNKPGQAPLRISTESLRGCPLDCGLCPEHRQHTCLALIEVNSACNLDCPVCFANAGAGFNLTVAEVETMLDRFVELEGHPEVVQFSGGEPTIHPDLLEMIAAAQQRDIGHVMVNTNGVRIADDPEWFERFAALRPLIYLQFDGLTDETYRTIRGEPLLETKLRALDRLAAADLHVILVAAVERGVNEHEVGPIVEFGLKHAAVRGVMFQPVTALRPAPGPRPDAADDHPGRATGAGVRRADLPDQRLRADPVLLPDLQLGHVRLAGRRRRGHPAAAHPRGRRLPRLHRQPLPAGHRPRRAPRAGGALVRRRRPG